MVKYSCERCGWKTNIKTHLRNHLKRKFPCKPTLKNVSQKTLLVKLANVSMHVSIIKKNVSLNVNPVSLNVNPVSPNVSIIRKNVSPNVSPNVSLKTYNEHKIYVCSKCNKTFKHRQSKYRHEKKNICSQIILADSTKEELLQELNNIKKKRNNNLNLLRQCKKHI